MPLDGGTPRHPFGECFEMAQRAGRVPETQRQQPIPGGIGRQPDVIGAESRDRVEQGAIEEAFVQPAHLTRFGAPRLLDTCGRVLAVAECPAQAP